MKRTLAACLLAAAALAMLPSQASAWVCTATSPSGSQGWGRHPSSLDYARRRALLECAVRTPKRYTCRIASCN